MPVPEDIIEKIKKYCAYQERCEWEVRQKLKQLYSCSESESDNLIEQLQQENFINNSRFTSLYIRGKMEQKQWGRIKIQYQLIAKGIDKKTISQCFEAISEEYYIDNLNKIIEKWLRTNRLNRESYPKLYRFLASKGYESHLISSQLKKYDYDREN